MRNLLRNLIAGKGRKDQDDSGSKVITAADRVRLADEMAQALEQKSQGEKPPTPMLSSHRRRKAHREFNSLALIFAKNDSDYEFRRGQQTVAILNLISKPKYGDQQWNLIVDGNSYELAVDHINFYLRLDREIVASASKRLFLSVFNIVWGFEKYQLKPRFFLSRKFALLRGGRKVGSIAWEQSDSVNNTIDIPDEIELAVQIFITWLVMYVDLHMRSDQNA